MIFIIESKKYGKFEVLIDDEDSEKVLKYKWYIAYDYSSRNKKLSRVYTYYKGKWFSLHTFLTGYSYCDHKDGNVLNNQKTNLRQSTHAQNSHNQSIRVTNKSGYKGVSFYKRYNKWVAHIIYNYKSVHLGYFENIIDAAKAYNEAAIKYHGEFARLNTILEI